MNSLTITLCILMEATVIIAETIRLSLPNTPPVNANQFATSYIDDDLIDIRFENNTEDFDGIWGITDYSENSSSISPSTISSSTARSYSEGPAYSRLSNFLYSYNYTDTDFQVQEAGYLNDTGIDQEILEVRGNYSYTDNEGNTFSVSYVANENGFQPEGAHLPKIPPLIKKALQYITEHPKENGK